MIVTKYDLPTNCEFCGSPLMWEGVNLVCANKDCQNVSDKQIETWVMNIAPISGLGYKTIKKFLDEIKIYSLDELYRHANNNIRYTPTRVHKVIKPGSEKDLYNKMLDKLCEPTTVSQFLLALNIPGLGKIGAKSVEDSGLSDDIFKDILSLETNQYEDKLGKLLQDDNVAHSIYNGYRDYFSKCYSFVKINYPNTESNILVKKEKGTVVITGTLSMKRADFEILLLNNGWKLGSKVNKDTKYLITNTPNSGTSKNKEADKFGVCKITENDFLKII